ncbi:hypothetical protein KGQ71_04380 [Patescibacteria group bacterium]|nr:hypothetical protein [Patescibacteria group bacterium]
MGLLQDGTLNDVGIVYGQHSTYVLSVYTTGSSWSSIANVANAVYEFMNASSTSSVGVPDE